MEIVSLSHLEYGRTSRRDVQRLYALSSAWVLHVERG
jgi:hypothetical protein